MEIGDGNGAAANEANNEADNEEDDDSDDLFVRQTGPDALYHYQATEELETNQADMDNAVQALTDAFEHFGLNFSVGDLQHVFAHLRIKEDTVPAPRRQRRSANPFIDDSEEEEEGDRDGDVTMADA